MLTNAQPYGHLAGTGCSCLLAVVISPHNPDFSIAGASAALVRPAPASAAANGQRPKSAVLSQPGCSHGVHICPVSSTYARSDLLSLCVYATEFIACYMICAFGHCTPPACVCFALPPAGQVWPAVSGGGPSGTLPPHSFKVLFKEGGIGTFYPLFYALTERARKADAAARQATLAHNSQVVQELVHKA